MARSMLRTFDDNGHSRYSFAVRLWHYYYLDQSIHHPIRHHHNKHHHPRYTLR